MSIPVHVTWDRENTDYKQDSIHRLGYCLPYTCGYCVTCGPEAAAEVEILVLKGDYAGHEAFNGKSEDFNKRIVSKMEGKTSVLQGTTTLKLKEGISSIGHLSFTQNSGWTRNLKLCPGARALNSFPGTTIQPAETESFDLKNNRITAYAKKEVPSLLDKVSALNHIGRGITKRLTNGSINTLKDLLVVLNTNPQSLQEVQESRILGFDAETGIEDNRKHSFVQ